MRVARRGVSTAIVAVLVVVILVVAGAAIFFATRPSGVTTTTVTSTNTNGSVFVDPPNLVQLAQQEGGAITMYSILDPTSFSVHYLPAFLQQYPWAKVNFIPLDPGTLFTRPLAEYQSGHVTADVDQFDIANCLLLNQSGAVQPENFTTTDKADTIPNTYWSTVWTPIKIDQNVIFYNTNLVNNSDSSKLPVPKSLEDLSNPIYKGQLGIAEPSDNSVPGANFVGEYFDVFHANNASWTSWMQGVKANSVFEPFGGAAYTAVSQGQIALGIDTLNDIFNGVEAGLPVAADWTVEPTYTIVDASCTMKGAPHPYMAMLFDEWLLSSAGQIATINTGGNPMTPSMVALNTFEPANATFSALGDRNYEYNFSLWSSVFKNIFGA